MIKKLSKHKKDSLIETNDLKTNKTINNKKKTYDDKQKNIKRAKNYQTNEEVDYMNKLLKQGYQIHYMIGDGNCLFRSIAHQLHNDVEEHINVRLKIMNYIEDNSEYFSLFIEDDENIDSYILRMRNLYEWGGHQELYAVSQVFYVDVIIHQSNAPDYVIKATPIRVSCSMNKILHLSYHGDCHYNSITCIPSSSLSVNEYNNIINTSSNAIDNDHSIDLVIQSVPWVNNDMVITALKLNNSNIDASIEWLCINIKDDCKIDEDLSDAQEANKSNLSIDNYKDTNKGSSSVIIDSSISTTTKYNTTTATNNRTTTFTNHNSSNHNQEINRSMMKLSKKEKRKQAKLIQSKPNNMKDVNDINNTSTKYNNTKDNIKSNLIFI